MSDRYDKHGRQGSAALTPPTPLWARAREGQLQDTDAVLVAREWLDSDAWALLMLGGVGMGKSQAAAWLWLGLRHEAIEQAQTPGRFDAAGEVLWLRARALERMTWQDRSETLSRCATAYGLVVDELGGEGERTSQALGDVLEERGDRMARTAMTSNMTGEQFLGRYGDRLVSRLRAAGIDGRDRARWVRNIRGDDLRGRVGRLEIPVADEGQQVTEEQRAKILAEYPDAVPVLTPIEEQGEDDEL